MFKHWCEITSCNGVIDLYESRKNKSGCVLWSVVMVTMVVATIWFSYRTAQIYFQQPTVTNVGTVPQAQLDLPEVMICYNGGLNVSAMKSKNWSENLIQDFSKALKAQLDVSFDLNSMNEFSKYMNDFRSGVKKVLETLAFKCTDIITNSSFAHVSRNVCFNISRVISSQGKCYLIRNIGKQYYPGLSGGIRLLLKQPQNSFYEVFPEIANENEITNDFSIALEKVLGLQITGRSLLIPLGSKVEVTLNTKRYLRLSKRKECDNGFNVINSNAWFLKCYVDWAIENCECAPLDYWDESKSLPNTTLCNPFTFSRHCYSLFDRNKVNKCQATCMPKCDEWIFESTVAYSPLNNSKTVLPFSIVYIGYNTMQYTQIEEVEAFSIDMAVANVGGQAGLWLGASIVTIIQAVYYLCLALCNKFSTKTEVTAIKK